jgi:ribosomal protein S18 acetylase RimI-like enzyme
MTLMAAMEASWPAASARRVGPWTVREGRGGGHRVSATTAEGSWSGADIPAAEAAMAALGQAPLFMIREGEEALDEGLAARGHVVVTPVVLYAAPVAALTDADLPPLSGFPHWPPLAVTRDLWAGGGIGAGRLAVMERAPAPKAAILARTADRAGGAAFVAAAGPIAFIHAIHVAPDLRRQGTGRALMRVAAAWAQEAGARTLALAVERANAAARGLYEGLGMAEAGQYHYRGAAG